VVASLLLHSWRDRQTDEGLIVLNRIKNAAENADKKDFYQKFSADLQARLRNTPLKFEPSASASKDKLDFLDQLVQKLQTGPPQPMDPNLIVANLIDLKAQAEKSQTDLDALKNEIQKPKTPLLLYLLTLFTIAILGLLGYVLFRLEVNAKPSVPPAGARPGQGSKLPERLGQPQPVMPSLATLERNLEDIKNQIRGQVEQGFEKSNTLLATVNPKILDLRLQLLGELSRIRQEIRNLPIELAKSLATIRDKQPPASTPDSSVSLERGILEETWNRFQQSHKEVLAAVDSTIRDDRWRKISDPLLVQLPKIVPEDLKPTFDAVTAPVKDFYNLQTKLSVAERLAKNDIGTVPDVQELMRLREYTYLLVMIQNSNLLADRLSFRLEPWVTDHFLGFADLFLQKCQQAQMDNQEAQGQLQQGLQIVRQVLKIAELEPIEIVPGVTPFDSTRHVGRSTASDAKFGNGVIVGVIRNGFVRGGQKVIRQPEVIVNRLA